MEKHETLSDLDNFLYENAFKDKSYDPEENPMPEEHILPDDYALAGLNIRGNVPLEKIVKAVARFRKGERRPGVDRPRLNILLTGVPGSGKSSFVRYLARGVDAPLHTLRASDLLSKWIGESEQNIAHAFKAAKKKNAILFLDEIDSFLQDRTGASHSWEVTQVNELLQQMEDFSGVMIGATNFKDNLDQAVLRRFTFKVELDYLEDEGKEIFFQRFFRHDLTNPEKAQLYAIENLTPGDFRTVSEELYYIFDGCETNADRLQALQKESDAKRLNRVKIGF